MASQDLTIVMILIFKSQISHSGQILIRLSDLKGFEAATHSTVKLFLLSLSFDYFDYFNFQPHVWKCQTLKMSHNGQTLLGVSDLKGFEASTPSTVKLTLLSPSY